LAGATEAFLDHADLAVTSRRAYTASLSTLGSGLGPDRRIDTLDAHRRATFKGMPAYHEPEPLRRTEPGQAHQRRDRRLLSGVVPDGCTPEQPTDEGRHHWPVEVD
jgi:hypothetical protein